MPTYIQAKRFSLRFEQLEKRSLLSIGGPQDAATASATFSYSPPDVDSDRALLVRFHESINESTETLIYGSLGAEVAFDYPGGPTIIELPNTVARESAFEFLEAQSWVTYVERDELITRDGELIPNDPGFSDLWGLENSLGVDINAPLAWDATNGGQSTVVAVLDTGIDLSHPDLASQIWVNPGEIPGNGLDDDANGYIDDIHGWNFHNSSPNVSDLNGHGTHVAGTIGASGNNGYGVAGVSWGAQLMAVSVLGPDGSGRTSDAIAGVYYAQQNGARVINASWGGPSYSRALADAIRNAGLANPATGQRGAVFVSAAGNQGANNDFVPSYPANNRFENTITVAAVDINGRLANFSNYGSRTVDIAAPGVQILSTTPGNTFSYYSGTSMAAPHVSGVVALAAAAFPTETAAELVDRVLDAATPMTTLVGRVVTSGLVDAAATLGLDPAPTPEDPTPTTPPPTQEPVTPVENPGPTETAPPPPSSSDAVDPLPLNPSPTTGDATDLEVRAAILASDEFFNQHGASFPGYVEAIYQSILGRAAEPSGMSTWVGQLNAGASRLSVARSILSSSEANRTLVASWFQSDLLRQETVVVLKNDPSVQQWAELLDGGTRPDEVRRMILSSDEFGAIWGGGVEGRIVGTYRALLGRDPNLATINAAAREIRAGRWDSSDLVLAILTYDEAPIAKVARWYRFDLGRDESIAILKVDSGVQTWANLLPRG